MLPLAPVDHGKDPGSGNTVVPDPGRVSPEVTGLPVEIGTIVPGPGFKKFKDCLSPMI